MDLTEAYRECERITWSQARNFAYGIRLLPHEKRRGLAVIYAFARRIDDIGDGTLPGQQADMPAEQKIADLEAARQAVLNLDGATGPASTTPCCSRWPTSSATSRSRWRRSGNSSTAAWPTSAAPATRRSRTCTTTAAAWPARSDGCRWASSARPTHDQQEAARLADSLGVALQLTNILRDIREDHAERAGLPARRGPGQVRRSTWTRPQRVPSSCRLVEFEAERARDWYAAGWQLLPMLDRRSAACTGAMAGIYRRLLERIAAQPAAVLDSRVSLSTGEKAMVAAARPGRGGSDELRKVVVIGGGLAGITAAIALAETGADVTLLEARPRLGGATCSFSRDGLTVDTGQHIFLGCCSAYRGLLDRLGMTGHATLQDRFDVTVLAPGRQEGQAPPDRAARPAAYAARAGPVSVSIS